VLAASQQGFVCVEAYFVLLHIGVYQNHRLDLVINAVADKVVLQDHLFPKDETEVNFCQKLINVAIVFPNKLIQYVLKNGSYFCEGEHIIFSQILSLFVALRIMRQVF
jgi:hypothetical protein